MKHKDCLYNLTHYNLTVFELKCGKTEGVMTGSSITTYASGFEGTLNKLLKCVFTKNGSVEFAENVVDTSFDQSASICNCYFAAKSQ